MGDWDTSVLRSELLERRSRLEAVQAARSASEEVGRLLHEIDDALRRMDDGTYGICVVCNTPIEPDRLMADPLARVCLEDLDASERRALEQDLELALRIQTTLLPQRGLRCAGWAAHYHYAPAGPVSGDFCDLAPAGNRLFFVVGDVAGKGIAASLLMSHIHATFRTLLSVGTTIEEMLARANHLFSSSTMPSHYATLACGFADPSGEIEISNAGHATPLIMRRGGVEQIESTGLPLGLFRDTHHTATRLQLGEGESLVLYTDGLTEAANTNDEEYGLARLMSVLPRCASMAAEQISEACLEDLRTFLAGTKRKDDLTMLVLRRGEA